MAREALTLGRVLTTTPRSTLFHPGPCVRRDAKRQMTPAGRQVRNPACSGAEAKVSLPMNKACEMTV
jgi:hypothetical protein